MTLFRFIWMQTKYYLCCNYCINQNKTNNTYLYKKINTINKYNFPFSKNV